MATAWAMPVIPRIVKAGGSIAAPGASFELVTDGRVVVEPGARISASGGGMTSGGEIRITAASVRVQGEITADSGPASVPWAQAPGGGRVEIQADALTIESGGQVTANGVAPNARGGAVALVVRGAALVTGSSTVSADGAPAQRPIGTPDAGTVTVRADTLTIDVASRVGADGRGPNGKGGTVEVVSVTSTTVGTDSRLSAVGGTAKRPLGAADGGDVTVYSGTMTVAATGTVLASSGPRSDGGPARLAKFRSTTAVAAGRDGNLYIADIENHRIRRVDGEGRIDTVVGRGSCPVPGDSTCTFDGYSGLKANLYKPTGVAVAPDGSLYIADSLHDRVRWYHSLYPGFGGPDEITLPSEDGVELYRFSEQGRHLATLDALTGAELLSFTPSAGQLERITDASGDYTSFTRPTGHELQIEGPYVS
jgi:hypothetical protein